MTPPRKIMKKGRKSRGKITFTFSTKIPRVKIRNSNSDREAFCYCIPKYRTNTENTYHTLNKTSQQVFLRSFFHVFENVQFKRWIGNQLQNVSPKMNICSERKKAILFTKVEVVRKLPLKFAKCTPRHTPFNVIV